jgi:hypothetical protein
MALSQSPQGMAKAAVTYFGLEELFHYKSLQEIRLTSSRPYDSARDSREDDLVLTKGVMEWMQVEFKRRNNQDVHVHMCEDLTDYEHL